MMMPMTRRDGFGSGEIRAAQLTQACRSAFELHKQQHHRGQDHQLCAKHPVPFGAA
jgi:hypothetical protein